MVIPIALVLSGYHSQILNHFRPLETVASRSLKQSFVNRTREIHNSFGRDLPLVFEFGQEKIKNLQKLEGLTGFSTERCLP